MGKAAKGIPITGNQPTHTTAVLPAPECMGRGRAPRFPTLFTAPGLPHVVRRPHSPPTGAALLPRAMRPLAAQLQGRTAGLSRTTIRKRATASRAAELGHRAEERRHQGALWPSRIPARSRAAGPSCATTQKCSAMSHAAAPSRAASRRAKLGHRPAQHSRQDLRRRPDRPTPKSCCSPLEPSSPALKGRGKSSKGALNPPRRNRKCCLLGGPSSSY